MGSLKSKLKIESNVQSLRTKNNITQQELADEIGVTRATINAIERGDYNPSLELAFRLSFYFKKNINEIFSVESKR